MEVIRDILDILHQNNKLKITRLIYKSNLSSNSIKPYLNELLKSALIKQVIIKDKMYYKITQKGLQFLHEFDKIKVFSEAYGLKTEI
jgi:predicted transcriptional regulator